LDIVINFNGNCSTENTPARNMGLTKEKCGVPKEKIETTCFTPNGAYY